MSGLPGTGLSQSEMYDLVAQFMRETKNDVDTAFQYLKSAGWKSHLALNAFYRTETQDSALTDVEDLERDIEELESDLEGAELSDEMSVFSSDGEDGEVRDQGTVTDYKSAQQAANAAENPGLDRKPAQARKGPQTLKLIITLVRNGVRHSYTYGHEVDWEDPSSVRRLNRWRTQVFLNGGLPPVRNAIVRFLPVEEDFIIDRIRQAKHAHDQSGISTRFRPHWNDMQQQFNERFEGKMLEGSSVRRIHRSCISIKTHADRLQEVADMRGGKLRKDAQKREARSGRGRGKEMQMDDEEGEVEDGNGDIDVDDGDDESKVSSIDGMNLEVSNAL
ncbi:MAG: hypothetical protein FRX48_09615 [Lasallia pustulata]|uniref:UBA-like n=1 Tax=Lasallia pustulata TaxID=136370 RepID=A0A5M8PC90_9LECA|nr:MAG: hypothetical protein FRX48_09615 [Lasallia pustulata]